MEIVDLTQAVVLGIMQHLLVLSTAWRPTSKAAIVYGAGDCARQSRQGSFTVGGGPCLFVAVQPSCPGAVAQSLLSAEHRDRTGEALDEQLQQRANEGIRRAPWAGQLCAKVAQTQKLREP